MFGATQGNIKSDFIVIEQLSKLVVYNKFGQTLSPDELQSFPQFAPLKILNRKVLLSDGISFSISVEYNAKQYSILTEANGVIVNRQNCGFLKIFSADEIQGESFEVLQSDIKASNYNGIESILKKGERYKLRYRIDDEFCFYNEKNNCFQLIKSRILFDAKKCKLYGSSKEAKILDKGSIVRGLTDIILMQNKEIRTQYELLNKVNHTAFVPPHLQLFSSDNKITFHLSGEYVTGAFNEYFIELLKIVNDYLIGTKYFGTLINGGLEIRL